MINEIDYIMEVTGYNKSVIMLSKLSSWNIINVVKIDLNQQ